MRRPSQPCSASWLKAWARALTRARPPAPSPWRRASPTAGHGVEVRSSATSARHSYPVGRARQTSIRRSKHVASPAPRLARPSSPVHASFSPAAAGARSAAANAGITLRKAEGAHPPCPSRGRRVKHSRMGSSPPPRVRPNGERVATPRRVNPGRPSSGSHHPDSGWPCRRSRACVRRGPRLVDSPGCWAMRRTPGLP